MTLADFRGVIGVGECLGGFRIRREEGVVASAVNLQPRGRGLQVMD